MTLEQAKQPNLPTCEQIINDAAPAIVSYVVLANNDSPLLKTSDAPALKSELIAQTKSSVNGTIGYTTPSGRSTIFSTEIVNPAAGNGLVINNLNNEGIGIKVLNPRIDPNQLSNVNGSGLILNNASKTFFNGEINGTPQTDRAAVFKGPDDKTFTIFTGSDGKDYQVPVMD